MAGAIKQLTSYLTEGEAKTAGGKAFGLWQIARFLGNQSFPVTYIVPPDVSLEELDAWARETCVGATWAVRSSALNEDGVNASFAGQHLSKLKVRAPFISRAVKAVRESAKLSEDYAVERGLATETTMPVLVQRMLSPTHSGVYLSADITRKDYNTFVIEMVEGLGDKLVSGEVTPQRFTRANYVYSQIPHIVQNYCQALENTLRYPVDIEWAVVSPTPRFYFLQVRPLIVPLDALSGQKVGASQTIQGRVHRLPDDSRPFEPGEILVTEMTNPRMIQEMIKCAGIITEVGGSTCHAAIVANELQKPAVIGVAMAKYLQTGQLVTLNAQEGTVTIHE